MFPDVVRVRVKGHWYRVELRDLSKNPAMVLVDGDPVYVEVSGLPIAPAAWASVSSPAERGLAPGGAERLADAKPRRTPVAGRASPSAGDTPKEVRAPMAGVIVSIAVRPGDKVEQGNPVCVLEAMKMQQALRCDVDGTVTSVRVEVGQQVRGGQVLVELE